MTARSHEAPFGVVTGGTACGSTPPQTPWAVGGILLGVAGAQAYLWRVLKLD